MFYVYIVTNKPHGVLYTGMTDDINKRAHEHRSRLFKGFASRYNCDKLVWFDVFESREAAFTKERQIKEWRRDWKIRMIEEANPNWRDLAQTLL